MTGMQGWLRTRLRCHRRRASGALSSDRAWSTSDLRQQTPGRVGASAADYFAQVVRARRAVRAFTDEPVALEEIHAVLEAAQLTPSNCNTQPWSVHIVSGGMRNQLSEALVQADAAGERSWDFTFSTSDFHGVYRERSQAQGAAYYDALGIARRDYEMRRDVAGRNLTFFGAPHVAMLFLPSFGDHVRVAADVGMYAQTFLLALTSRGLAGVPQTQLGLYADTVRRVLGVSSAHRLLFGISFGHPDTASPSYGYRIGRCPIEDSVTFHR